MSIMEREEQIYRLRHHDFGGLTVGETAKKLGICKYQVQRTLRNLKIKAPQLFPILTKRQALVKNYIEKQGLKHAQIAVLMDVSPSAISHIAAVLKTKDVLYARLGRMEHYAPHMDKDVKQKF